MADSAFSCLSCGAAGLQALRRYRVQTRAGKALFGRCWLRECDSCGLVQAHPGPDAAALAAYYASAYWEATHPAGDLADVALFPRDNLALFNRGLALGELVAAHARRQPARILDIGAGPGHVLHALGDRYPSAAKIALESSEGCQRHLRSLGIQVVDRPVEQFLSDREGPFDVIVLSHSLEHLLQPRDVLSALRESLSPGGLLIVEVPNIPAESKGRLIDHKWVSPYDEPHMTFFSTASLQGLLRLIGYDVVLCDTAGPEYQRYRTGRGAAASVRSFLRRTLPQAVRRRLGQQRAGAAARDESFYQYGGPRIWIRCVAAAGQPTLE